jgi:hypothetical protein
VASIFFKFLEVILKLHEVAREWRRSKLHGGAGLKSRPNSYFHLATKPSWPADDNLHISDFPEFLGEYQNSVRLSQRSKYKLHSSGLRRRVVSWMATDVSEAHSASIFRAKLRSVWMNYFKISQNNPTYTHNISNVYHWYSVVTWPMDQSNLRHITLVRYGSLNSSSGSPFYVGNVTYWDSRRSVLTLLHRVGGGWHFSMFITVPPNKLRNIFKNLATGPVCALPYHTNRQLKYVRHVKRQ